MKLIVNNLGAVRHAEVDLSKDFLLFTGANNTGKTYLAYVVYAAYKLKYMDDLGFLSLEEVKDYKFSETINLDDFFDLYSDKIGQKIHSLLPAFFATNSKSFENTEIAFSGFESIVKEIIDNEFELEEEEFSDGVYLKIWKPKKSSKVQITVNIDQDKSLGRYGSFNGHIPDFLERYFYEVSFRNKCCLFSAERSTINVFSKELSLIKSRLFSGFFKNSTPQEFLQLSKDRINRYSQPIRDELASVERYDAIQKNNSDFGHLAGELEAQFLSGKVSVTEGGDLQFSPDGNGKILEIHTTSSTVKSLSPIVFYLRHQAQKGDFIIIDEPELNLHPDNQRKIARFFGRLINEGFKVLISTHSDYIVRELNNLIMLGSGLQTKPEETRELMKIYGYVENELLKKEQIAPYLFRVGKDVAEIPVTETGFNVETIDEEAQKINQSSQNIYFTLFDA